MRKAVVLLSLTTIGFGASTAYLAYLLHARPGDAIAGNVAAATDPVDGTAPAPAASLAQGAARTGVASAAVATPAMSPASAGAAKAAVTAPNAGSSGDLMKTFARQFLDRYEDSARRIGLLDETRATLRRQYEALRKKLDLSDSEYEQLLGQLAEEQLDMQSRYFRCLLNPKCNANDPSQIGPPDDRSQELLALLGADGMDELKNYRTTLSERDAVAQLRGRLADANFLPEPLAERLVSALGDERNRYQQEITAAGGRVSGWGTNLGMLFYQNDGGTLEQQLADAARYSQRMRQRAATVLSAAQLAAFVQMQEELLAQMAASLGLTKRR